MKAFSGHASILLCLLIASCTPDQPETVDGSWQGTITTEGGVTTVVNESGSVWGGTAKLLEEASIGVAAGADEYMFGYVSALYLTEDRVYVVDGQAPAVRAYDYEGEFILTYGGEGQGPGEYTRPEMVAADASGRVFVLDNQLGRINVYAPSGEPAGTWPLETRSRIARRMFALVDGAIWKPVYARSDQAGIPRLGAQAVGPTGSQDVVWAPDIDCERSTFESPIGDQQMTPFSASVYSSPASDGRLVYGASDRYRFEVSALDGSRLTVERYWDPVPVSPEHKEWQRCLVTASTRAAYASRSADAAAFELDSSRIPDHKPAYRWFVPAQSGEIWLHRLGPSEPLTGCAGDPLEVGWSAAREDPCWRDRAIIDAFNGDGRYLGDVEVPENVMRYAGSLTIRGRVVAGFMQDDAGTYMVKRYRLVLPGEE